MRVGDLLRRTVADRAEPKFANFNLPDRSQICYT